MNGYDIYREYGIKKPRRGKGNLSLIGDVQSDITLIVCPGGGYTGLAPHEGVPVAEKFASLGIRTYQLLYSVSPVRFPYALTEALCAIDFVRKMHGGKVGILGFSAGGHLAGSAATLFDKQFATDAIKKETGLDVSKMPGCRPDYGVLCYPVVSTKEVYAHEGSFNALCGRKYSHLRDSMSLENQVSETTPPIFFWHTRADNGVPYQNSVVMSDALASFGTKTEVLLFPNGHHGLGLGNDERYPEVRVWPEKCAEFLFGTLR